MSSLSERKRLIEENQRAVEREARAERRAALEVGGASFADILRFNNLNLEYASFDKKKEVNVRGQDIFDLKTMRKFFAHTGKVDSLLMSLVDDVDVLVEAYNAFLETSFTERYQNLNANGKSWRRKVVRLAITYRIMENKLTAYLEGDRNAFADGDVAYFWTLIRTIRTAMVGVARVINSILKDEGNAQYWLDKFFNEHYKQFHSLPSPQRDGLLRLVILDNESMRERNE